MNGKSIAGASPTEAFKRIRERTGLSLKALAVAAGYKGPSSLQRYEEDGAYPDGLPYRFIQKVLPVLVKEGIPEGEVLALSDLSARPSVDPSSVTKNLDDIPVSRIKSFVTALAEYSMETKTPLSPEDQGDIVATVCRWYEEQVAAGREPADVTTAHAKSFIALTLSSRPL